MTYIFSLRPTQPFSPGPVYEIPTAGFSADWLQSFLTPSVITSGRESNTQ